MAKRKAPKVPGRGRGRPPKRKRGPRNFSCTICMELKPMDTKFQAQKPACCKQSFCTECITKHIDAKVQDDISAVECPNVDCRVVIDTQRCINVIPKEVFDRWESALSKAMISTSTTCHCPFPDCSAGLMVEEVIEKKGDDEEEEKKKKADDCPHCKRQFCRKCNVAWHDDMECEEFQKSGEENVDVLLRKLAKDKLWMRCPECKFYVERVRGCLHIHCRCGCDFCYGCGSKYGHGSHHYCSQS